VDQEHLYLFKMVEVEAVLVERALLAVVQP
jgi:hypothetical protein